MRRWIALLFMLSITIQGLHDVTLADEATPIPQAPVLLSPENGAAVEGVIEFTWAMPRDISSARIEFAQHEDFTSIVVAEDTTNSSFVPDEELQPGQTYFWRVWAISAAVEPVVSEVWTFTILVEPTVTSTATPEETITLEPTPTETGTPVPSTPVETVTTEPTTGVTLTPVTTPTHTAIVTRTPEPTPATRSDLAGKVDPKGYRLSGVGRSQNSVHPSVLVDGNLATIWTSPATYPDSAYLVLALDSQLPVGAIQWMFGKTGRADQIRISVSRDRTSWTEIGRARNAELGTWQKLNVDRTIRYIRFTFVNIRGDRWLGGLVEVRALAPVTDPQPTATQTPIVRTPVPDGIVRNASFEQGANNWYLESGARVSSTSALGGTKALALTRTGGYADQRVALKPGSTYELVVWARLTRTYDVGLVGIVYRDSSGKRMWDLEPAPIEFTATRFTSGELQFVVPAGVARAQVFVWKQLGGAGFFVDDFRLRSVGEQDETDPPGGNPESCQQLMVPGYFDPRTTDLWNVTTQSGSGVGLVIFNPNSGVNDEYDPVWATVVKNSLAAGFTVLAYVQTDFGDRSSSSVIAEMNTYRSWYGVKDFFLDEADTTYGSVERYRAMVNNVHRGGGIAVLNFGWMPHPAYMEFTDVAGVFEDSYAVYRDDYDRPAWFHNYPPNRFLHIIHSTPSSKWTTAIEQSRARNAGYVWVTDDNTVSYYKSLPSFWTKLNETVQTDC